MNKKNYPTVKLNNITIPKHWNGDKRVEPFIVNVDKALERSGLTGQKRIDVYNRAYEAIYNAITKYGGSASNE